mgnify:CR=1 FL=1
MIIQRSIITLTLALLALYAPASAQPPSLLSPANGATAVTTAPTLSWTGVSGATSYRCQVGFDTAFTAPAFDDSTLIATSVTIDDLGLQTTYYWRVRAHDGGGDGAWSARRSFTTAAVPTVLVGVRSAWNLVSLPSQASDPRASVLFPSAQSAAYHFEAGTGYVAGDSLVPGVGYWMKFPDTATVPITGTPVRRDTIALAAGWNLIGAIANAIPADAVGQFPNGFDVLGDGSMKLVHLPGHARGHAGLMAHTAHICRV